MTEAAVVTEPEATLICHTLIRQSAASSSSSSWCSSSTSPASPPPPALPLVFANRHLSKTRGQPGHRVRWPTSTFWWSVLAVWMCLMKIVAVYIWQAFSPACLVFFLCLVVLAPSAAAVHFTYSRQWLCLFLLDTLFFLNFKRYKSKVLILGNIISYSDGLVTFTRCNLSFAVAAGDRLPVMLNMINGYKKKVCL